MNERVIHSSIHSYTAARDTSTDVMSDACAARARSSTTRPGTKHHGESATGDRYTRRTYIGCLNRVPRSLLLLLFVQKRFGTLGWNFPVCHFPQTCSQFHHGKPRANASRPKTKSLQVALVLGADRRPRQRTVFEFHRMRTPCSRTTSMYLPNSSARFLL